MARKRFFRIFIIIVFAAAAVPAALQLTKPPLMPRTAAAQSPAASKISNDAALVRDIENNLIAPCCWTQPISEHPKELRELDD